MTKLCVNALTGKKKKKRGWQRMHQRGAMNGESEQESRRKKIYSQDLRNEQELARCGRAGVGAGRKQSMQRLKK